MLGFKLNHISKRAPLSAIAGTTIMIPFHYCQATATPLKMENHEYNLRIDTFSKELLQFNYVMIHSLSNPANGHQGDMPYSQATHTTQGQSWFTNFHFYYRGSPKCLLCNSQLRNNNGSMYFWLQMVIFIVCGIVYMFLFLQWSLRRNSL